MGEYGFTRIKLKFRFSEINKDKKWGYDKILKLNKNFSDAYCVFFREWNIQKQEGESHEANIKCLNMSRKMKHMFCFSGGIIFPLK